MPPILPSVESATARALPRLMLIGAILLPLGRGERGRRKLGDEDDHLSPVLHPPLHQREKSKVRRTPVAPILTMPRIRLSPISLFGQRNLYPPQTAKDREIMPGMCVLRSRTGQRRLCLYQKT